MFKLYRRQMIVFLLVLVLFVSIIIKVAYTQTIYGSEYEEKAYDLWTRDIPIKFRRGNIYDRNGKLIVGNKLAPTISLINAQIEDEDYVASNIANILGVSKESILKHIKNKVSVEIIKPEGKNISLEQAKKVSELAMKGVYISSDVVRYYPYGNVLSHVIGIVGSDYQGLTGIEYMYDDYLSGISGKNKIFTDAHGNKIDLLADIYYAPTRGMDIYLTIDIDVQVALERVMDNAVSQYSPEEVIGIVMDPNTSEVLAMASRPNYELDNYQAYSMEVINRNLPIWKAYEMGSTFKFITFSAGLEEKVFRVDERFYDNGYYIVDGVRIKDWKAGGHGEQTYYEVIQNSCNPGFINIGLRLGKDRLFSYIDKYGLGNYTNIDLIGESKGIMFNVNKIGNVEVATTAFGQGIALTPIQLVNASCACINGGNLNTPYILKAISVNETIVYKNEKNFVRKVISKETSDIMKDALERVVSLGTARNCYIEGYRIGGKTGTAQISKNGSYVEGKYILSFIGMGPMNDPKLVCYMAVNSPIAQIQYGGTVVAPMVKEVMEESMHILNIEKQSGGIPLSVRYYIDKRRYTVENYVGKNVGLIRRSIYYNIEIIGNGDKIISQYPEANDIIEEGGTVILYTN